MNHIEMNDTVTITYTGNLDNGEVFATVTDDNPFVLTIGQNQAPPTLEQALVGMNVGDTKKVRVGPDEGFGHRRKELVHSLSRKAISPKIIPQPGMVLSLSIERDGAMHKVPATIIEVSNDKVIVDYNHPLAGHHLTYLLTVIDITKSL